MRRNRQTDRRRRRRKRLRDQAFRQEIIDAAARLFRAKGYRATTMADIGGAVGLLRGSLYYYIPSKQWLLYAIVEAGTRGLRSRLLEVAHSAKPPVERLREAILMHLRFIAEHPDYAAVFLDEMRSLRNLKLRRAGRRLMNDYEQLFKALLDEGMAAKDFRRALDVQAVIFAILGMGNWVIRWFRPDGRLAIEQIAAEFADLVIDGLRIRDE